MKIHEYQAKELLRDAGIAVPQNLVASTPDEAAAAFKKLGGPARRGKGADSRRRARQRHDQGQPRAARRAASAQCRRSGEGRRGNLLGHKLVTIQTGPEGQTVRRVLVEAGCDIARELYLGIVIDRAAAMPVLMASSAGGMNIEEVAAKTPEQIFKEPFHPDSGLQPYQVRKLSAKLELTGPSVRSADKFMRSLCRLFVDLDCSLVEVNPLVVTKAGELLALDAKISFDDNALFRHPQLAELRDISEEEPERAAGRQGWPQLCPARWQHRLPRERRRPRNGDDGPCQAARRRTG